jgi:hypothetical protein
MNRPLARLILTGVITIGFALKSNAADPYYIYVKNTDKLFAQTSYQNALSISYLCKCYVTNRNLSFVSMDFAKAPIKPALPAKYYTMSQFAELALKKSFAKKNTDLDKAEIYVIEDYPKHKYRYYKAKFYTY